MARCRDRSRHSAPSPGCGRSVPGWTSDYSVQSSWNCGLDNIVVCRASPSFRHFHYCPPINVSIVLLLLPTSICLVQALVHGLRSIPMGDAEDCRTAEMGLPLDLKTQVAVSPQTTRLSHETSRTNP